MFFDIWRLGHAFSRYPRIYNEEGVLCGKIEWHKVHVWQSYESHVRSDLLSDFGEAISASCLMYAV